MATIIALANHKGGVGKTTSTASIGAALAEMGKRVLLVDLDSQANLTSSLMEEQPTATIYDSLMEGKPLPIFRIADNLSLTPSSYESLTGVDLDLATKSGRESVLKKAVMEVEPDFDFILLDCPPSLGLLSVNAFTTASWVIIPLTAEALPFQGLAVMQDFITRVKKHNPNLKLLGILMTRWENSNLSHDVEATLRQHFGNKVYQTKIRKNIALAEAPLQRKSIMETNPKSKGATDYKAVTAEIVEQVQHI